MNAQPEWLGRELEKLEGAKQRLPRLTPRQRQVVDLVVRGRTRGAIAEELGIAVATVDVHLRTVARRISDPAGLPAMRRIRRVY